MVRGANNMKIPAYWRRERKEKRDRRGSEPESWRELQLKGGKRQG